MKKDISYWMKISPVQVGLIFIAIFAAVISKDRYICEVVSILIISMTTKHLFDEMTLTLPFSRKEIWRTHFIIQTVLLAVFLGIKAVMYINAPVKLVIECIMVLFAHIAESNASKINEVWGIATIPWKIAIIIWFAGEINSSFNKRIGAMMDNKSIQIAMFICVAVLIIVDICCWRNRKFYR